MAHCYHYPSPPEWSSTFAIIIAIIIEELVAVEKLEINFRRLWEA
jgi:hypothetical protein